MESEDEDEEAEEITAAAQDRPLRCCALVQCAWLHLTMQEYNTFKKFTASLLARSSKIADSISLIESYLNESELADNDKKRASKPLIGIIP